MNSREHLGESRRVPQRVESVAHQQSMFNERVSKHKMITETEKKMNELWKHVLGSEGFDRGLVPL